MLSARGRPVPPGGSGRARAAWVRSASYEAGDSAFPKGGGGARLAGDRWQGGRLALPPGRGEGGPGAWSAHRFVLLDPAEVDPAELVASKPIGASPATVLCAGARRDRRVEDTGAPTMV